MNTPLVGMNEFLALGDRLVLFTLLALSAWVVALIVERWLVFRRVEKLYGAADSTDRVALAGQVEQLCLRAPEAFDRNFVAAFSDLEKTLGRGLSVLGTLGNSAPFIGLFGTVLGVIKAFQDLALAEQAGPGVVMAGISQALIATALGLQVAIPAAISYNYFALRQRRFRQNLADQLWISRNSD